MLHCTLHTAGVCYADGEGVVKDLATAAYWYEAAAKQKHDRAQYNLGMCFLSGLIAGAEVEVEGGCRAAFEGLRVV